MKKHSLIFILTLGALTACDPVEPPVAQQPASSPIVPASQPQSPVSASAIQSHDSPFAEFIQATESVKQKLNHATPVQADQLFAEHRKQLAPILEKLTQQQSEFLEQHYFDEQNWHKVAGQPDEPIGVLKQKMDELAEAQLRYVVSDDDLVDIQQSVDYYVNLFGGKVSPDVAAYIKLQAKHAKMSFAQDDSVQEFTVLGEQAFDWEQFGKQYPNSEYTIEAKKHFVQAADRFLFGTEHQPVMLTRETELQDMAEKFAQIEQVWADYAKNHSDSVVVLMLPEAKKIARLDDEQGAARLLASEKFRKVHFKQ